MQMRIECRHYKEDDFIRVRDFLKNIFGKWSIGHVFMPARWEYIVFHPNIVPLKQAGVFEQIGLWEEDGEIVAVAHFESELGEVYLDVDSNYTFLYSEMIDYAEANLYEIKEDGRKIIEFHVDESNETLKALLEERGYLRDAALYEVYSGRSILDELPDLKLPEGLHVKNIRKKEDDGRRLRVLWRGFDHAGEPDPKDLWKSGYMQSAPGYDPSINIVIENEEGNFVAYAGFWYDHLSRTAYIEPVCVDPDYRRMGLASIALTEGMRRCRLLGAENVYVASDAGLYKSLGFSQVSISYSWLKQLSDK